MLVFHCVFFVLFLALLGLAVDIMVEHVQVRDFPAAAFMGMIVLCYIVLVAGVGYTIWRLV